MTDVDSTGLLFWHATLCIQARCWGACCRNFRWSGDRLSDFGAHQFTEAVAQSMHSHTEGVDGDA